MLETCHVWPPDGRREHGFQSVAGFRARSLIFTVAGAAHADVRRFSAGVVDVRGHWAPARLNVPRKVGESVYTRSEKRVLSAGSVVAEEAVGETRSATWKCSSYKLTVRFTVSEQEHLRLACVILAKAVPHAADGSSPLSSVDCPLDVPACQGRRPTVNAVLKHAPSRKIIDASSQLDDALVQGPEA